MQLIQKFGNVYTMSENLTRKANEQQQPEKNKKLFIGIHIHFIDCAFDTSRESYCK